MQAILHDDLVKLHALLDKIHRHPPARTGKLTFRSMAEVPDLGQRPQDVRTGLKQELRLMGRELQRRSGSLRQLARVAIRDEKDATVVAAAWNAIEGFYQ